ncbi:MAG: cysteine desulfurase [Planctomycetota bacterium]
MHKAAQTSLDVAKIRKDFPILERQIFCKPLVFLDSAASAQKPRPVLDAMQTLYEQHYANIHRGVYRLSQEATQLFEEARDKVRDFIHAPDRREIVFVRGATEGINLIAQTHARSLVREGDEILVSEMEHHSNIVPWQLLCGQTGAVMKKAPINDAGEIIQEEFEAALNERTKIVAITHVSNALGTVNPIKEMVAKAHAVGATVVVDGAQAAPHMKIDVQDLDCDFYVASGHKMCGPTGSGFLYGKLEHLEAMPPYQGGGEMILRVTFEKSTWNEVPHKFEAGTPNIAGAVGLGAAIDYLEGIGMDAIAAYEADLLAYGTQRLQEVDGLRLVGTAANKASVLSFLLEGAHAHDIGTILDQEGIAIRTGHHCAQPVMQHYGVAATARASLTFFNLREELDQLVESLALVRKLLGV